MAPLTYVANEGSASVSVIDTSTNTVTATVTVGSGPYGVAIGNVVIHNLIVMII